MGEHVTLTMREQTPCERILYAESLEGSHPQAEENRVDRKQVPNEG